MSVWRAEHSSLLSDRGFSHGVNYVAPWYKSLIVGVCLCLDPSFLALQIWNRIYERLWLHLRVLLSDSSSILFKCFSQKEEVDSKQISSRVREMSSPRTLAYQNHRLVSVGSSAAKWWPLHLSKETGKIMYLWMWNQAFWSQKWLDANSTLGSFLLLMAKAVSEPGYARQGCATHAQLQQAKYCLFPASMHHSGLYTSRLCPYCTSGPSPVERERPCVFSYGKDQLFAVPLGWVPLQELLQDV